MTQWPHLSLSYVWKEKKSEQIDSPENPSYKPDVTAVATAREVQCEPQGSDEKRCVTSSQLKERGTQLQVLQVLGQGMIYFNDS